MPLGDRLNKIPCASQAPGKSPTKRHLEEEIATRLMLAGTAEVSLIPHLYNLPEDHHAWLWLRSIGGDIVVLGWLYPRATRWVLDRNAVRGREGVTLLPSGDDDSDPADAPPASQGIGAVNVPNRRIYVLDMREQSDIEVYLREIERIANEAAVPVVSLGMFPVAKPPQPTPAPAPAQLNWLTGESLPTIPNADPRRRWYPVID